MNAYQRRLVHQLVRKEFPKHRVFARNDGYFMQVEKLDVEREENVSFPRPSLHMGYLLTVHSSKRDMLLALAL